MDLISDLGTDLALAFLVEKRFGKKIESEEAARLIDRIRSLLESESTQRLNSRAQAGPEPASSRSAC